MSAVNINSNKNVNVPTTDSDVDETSFIPFGSITSTTSFNSWTIQYKHDSRKSRGAWGFYETQEEFTSMHLR